MDTFSEEKHKNDQRRPFPWRSVLLLGIGFALGVIVTLLIVPSRNQSIVYVTSSEGIELTATHIIEQATQMAGGVFVEPDNAQGSPQTDSLYATATAIIQQATATQAAMLTAAAGS